MDNFLDVISNAIWSMPTVALILGTGIYFTAKMRFLQLTSFNSMLKSFKHNILDNKKANPLRVISTALAATVGTGSITGVATALTLGGAGAIFWLWISAFFGMAVAYAEGVLSIKYRSGKKGGIMYALKNGVGEPKAAFMYAFFTVAASFGMGSMAQSNSAAQALSAEFSVSPAVTAMAVALTAAVCLFWSKDITGKLCSWFVPFLSIAYIAVTVAVIIKNHSGIIPAFEKIFSSAFGIREISAGAAGYAVKNAVSVGFKRGVFSNEAGLGTTAAIHAQSDVQNPHEQGLMNMLEVIIDTFIICTLTAIAILASVDIEAPCPDGAALVTKACRTVFGELSGKIVAISIAGFAAATVMGWSKIGLSAAEYLKSKGQNTFYKLMFTAAAFAGAVISLDTAWKISDIFNGLMIFPCMAALIILRKEIVGAFYSRPVDPKPFSPRSLSGREPTSSTSGKMTGVTTSCANRSFGSKV